MNKRKRDFYDSSRDIFTSDLDSTESKKSAPLFFEPVPSTVQASTNEVQTQKKDEKNEMDCSIISTNNIEEMVFAIIKSRKDRYSKEDVLKIIDRVCFFLIPPPSLDKMYSYIS